MHVLTIGLLITYSNQYSWLIESFSQTRLAIKHVNEKPNILSNVSLGLEVWDTSEDGTVSLDGVLRMKDKAVAFIGPFYSTECDPPARLASVLRKPIISPGSTSAELGDKAAYPYFMRTISSSDQEFQMLAVAIKTIFNWDDIIVLISGDDWGLTNYQKFFEECEQLGITSSAVYYTSTEDILEWSLESAIHSILASQSRIVVNFAYEYDQNTLFDVANELGALDNYVWFIAADFISDEIKARTDLPGLFISDRVSEDYDDDGIDTNTSLRTYLGKRWSTDTELYNCSVDGWPFNKTKLFSLDAPLWDTDDACLGDGEPDNWAAYAYDSVWFLATALDRMIRRGDDPNDGQKLRKELLSTRIDGYTGTIELDKESQDRIDTYHILNKNKSGHNNVVIIANELFNSTTDCLLKPCVELIGDITWPADITENPPDDIIDYKCEPGEYEEVDSLGCEPCGIGFYSSVYGAIECSACPAGKFATDSVNDTDNSGVVSGAVACANCSSGYFSSENASVVCSVCSGTNAWSREGASACDLCQDDSYLASDGTCVDCHRGAECSGVGDRTLETLNAKGKYMRFSVTADNFYKCLFGHRACSGGILVGNRACNRGYNGARCAACSRRYYKSGKRCKRCGNGHEQILSIVFYVLFLILFICLILVLLYKPPRFFRKALTETQGSVGASDIVGAMKWISSTDENSATTEEDKGKKEDDDDEFPILTAIIIKGKAIVTMYQILGGIPNATHLRFPTSYEVLERVSHLSSLSFFRLVPSRCLFQLSDSDNYIWDLVITTMSPILILLVLLAIYLIKRRMRHSLYDTVSEANHSRNDKILYGQIALLVVHFSLTICSTACFSVFVCDQYEIDHGETERYLRVAPSIRCDSRRWRRLIRPYAILMIIIWPVGCTLTYALLLWYCRQLLNPSQESWIHIFRRKAGGRVGGIRDSCVIGLAQSGSHQREVAATRDEELRNGICESSVLALSIRTIWIDFSPQYHYFEVIDVIRRILLSLVISLVSPGRPLQLVTACTTSFLFGEITMHLKPYLYDEDNLVASVCSMATALTFFASLCLNIHVFSKHTLAVIFFIVASLPLLTILYVLRGFLYSKCFPSPEDADIAKFMEKWDSADAAPLSGYAVVSDVEEIETRNGPLSKLGASQFFEFTKESADDDFEAPEGSLMPTQILTPPSPSQTNELISRTNKNFKSPVSLSIENGEEEKDASIDGVASASEIVNRQHHRPSLSLYTSPNARDFLKKEAISVAGTDDSDSTIGSILDEEFLY